MRFARYLAFGILAFVLSVGAAWAQNATAQSGGNTSNAPRNFGTFICSQKFDCSINDADQLTSQASDCLAHGFGIQNPGVFDNASLDSNNCMTGQLPPPANSQHPLTPICCVIPEGDVCGMSCQLLMY